MKFLCVPCDSPMKLQTVGPPERGSLSVVYSCPECGYEMAMLTNRVRNTDRPVTRRADRSRRRVERASSAADAERRRAPRQQMPVRRDDPVDASRGPSRDQAGEPIPVRWTAAAEARLANIPEFVRPMARTGIERFARERGAARSGREDPRRGPRLLRHVRRSPTSDSKSEPSTHR